jgi:YgiT-type zinc finger domain-containing protein
MKTLDPCPMCGSDFKHRVRPYPLNIQGRTVNVDRVSLWECTGCGFLIPTDEGGETIVRFMRENGMLPRLN